MANFSSEMKSCARLKSIIEIKPYRQKNIVEYFTMHFMNGSGKCQVTNKNKLQIAFRGVASGREGE